jgi:hypothetical protein
MDRLAKLLWASVALVFLLSVVQALWRAARAQETDGMEELCLTCWRQPGDNVYVTPYGTWREIREPEPPVLELDMGGRRQRERIREERRAEGKVP